MPLLWIIVLIVFVCWGGGFAFHVGGDFIHILLVVIVVLVIYELLSKRNTY